MLQNGRIEEAERHFRALVGIWLVRALRWFARFGNAERALMDVNESLLFPEQAQWLAKANRELGLGAAGPVVEAAEE